MISIIICFGCFKFFSHFGQKDRIDGYELLASCLRTHGEPMFLKECAHDCNAAWIDCPNHSLKYVGSCNQGNTTVLW